MEKVKIGVYVFTDMVKSRQTKSREKYFDGQNYIGLRYILSELTECDITYVSKDTINTVDYVLISLTSYYDEINLINELYGVKITSKIIVGGAGYNNVGLLRDIADFGIVGRGEHIIPAILRGDYKDGIYVKSQNYDLTTPIRIQPLSEFITIGDAYLGQYNEHSIGCQRKCFFCEYSFKHKYTKREDGYKSGIANRETLLQDVNWDNYTNKDFVTAIDGATERIRHIINKPISNEDITNKMLEIYGSKKDYLSLKLYCLLGYPFEDRFEPEEAVESIIKARRDDPHRLNVVIVSPHFMPMPFTPMECEPINWLSFRDMIDKYDFGKFGKGNINVFWPSRLASSPISAAEATIINRADSTDVPNIRRILCSSKYKSLTPSQKRSVMEKYFGDYLGRVDAVLPYIQRNNNVEQMKEIYYRRLSKYDKL